jgi:hypothetical protein
MNTPRSWLLALCCAALVTLSLACGDDSPSSDVDSNNSTNNSDNSANNSANNNENSANNGATNNSTNNSDNNAENNAENNSANNAENNAANNSDPGGPIHHQSFVPDGLRPTSAARVIVMGDSISAGVGADFGAQSYPSLLHRNLDADYPDDANTDLTSKFGSQLELVNVAVGGSTTGTMSRNQLPALQQRLRAPVEGHSIVVITIGGNDAQAGLLSGSIEGPLLDDAMAAITETIDFLQDPERFPDGTSIYLANVYDPSDGVGFVEGCFFNLEFPEAPAQLGTWDARYRQLAQERGFAVVDLLGAFHGHGYYYGDEANAYYDAADPALWFADDCIHPNPRGHHELRRLFFEAIDGAYVAD